MSAKSAIFFLMSSPMGLSARQIRMSGEMPISLASERNAASAWS